jgi:fucose permease
MLALSGGSVTMLPLAGTVVRRLGPARAVLLAAGVALTGLVIVGLAPTVWALALGLALVGSGVGIWDVAMNVEAADVERQLERDIMPRFHAGFSLGTVAGAAGGALAAAVDLPVRVHLPLVSLVVMVAVAAAVRQFLPWRRHADGPGPVDAIPAPNPGLNPGINPGISHHPEAEDAPGAAPGPRHSTLAAWFEVRTLMIGLLVFSMAMAEGSANDWLALALVDGYGAEHSLAAAGFGVFVAAMTAVRMLGPSVLSRFDHVVVLRGSALLVLAGTALVIGGAVRADGAGGGPDYAVAVLGAIAWGAGAALGFPMGMTAAATDAEHSAARVGVVSTIGYTAFLAGPPLLGALGQRVGVARSLVGVSIAVLLALLTAGAVRQPAEEAQAAPRDEKPAGDTT